MNVATWNVNSIRARLPRVTSWLRTEAPDVVCLQETKVPDEEFPAEDLRALGYDSVTVGQRGYNGVAILAREPLTEIDRSFGDDADDDQARFVAATVAGVRVMSLYVPNGQAVGTDKYEYKLTLVGRRCFRRLVEWGLADSVRLHHDEGGLFSWWDYRMASFKKHRGLRIDHILLSEPLAGACTGAFVDRAAREGKSPSDHAPVVVTLAR